MAKEIESISPLGFPALELDYDEDLDTVIGKDEHTATVTSAPSASQSKIENGRGYHIFQDDAYFLPNDEVEAARLDLQHATWKITFDGGPGRVPIKDDIRRVLDVGTGTGIWAIELAKAYPHLEVVGIDLSPIQPKDVPSNCRFAVENAEHPWQIKQKFDYIHARMLTMGMHDWPRFFEQCWDHLEPGGWLEVNEAQFPPKRFARDAEKDSPFIRWGEQCLYAASKAGINARASENFVSLLETQGFVQIEKLDVPWPVGPWAQGNRYKVMGRLVHENTQKAVPAAAMGLFTRQLGMTKDQVDREVKHFLEDVNDSSNHFFYPMCLHKAQKPPL